MALGEQPKAGRYWIFLKLFNSRVKETTVGEACEGRLPEAPHGLELQQKQPAILVGGVRIWDLADSLECEREEDIQ